MKLPTLINGIFIGITLGSCNNSPTEDPNAAKFTSTVQMASNECYHIPKTISVRAFYIDGSEMSGMEDYRYYKTCRAELLNRSARPR